MIQNKERITQAQIAKALYINGDENTLLKNIKSGDKAAMVKLVMLYMPNIIHCIETDYSNYKISKTELIDNAIRAFIDYAAQYTIVEGEYIYDKLGKYLRNALNPLLDGVKSKRHYALLHTPTNLVKLSKINRLLIDKEKQIMKRILEYFEIIKMRIKNKDKFTQNYEMELEVCYFGTPNYGDPIYTYFSHFRFEGWRASSKGKFNVKYSVGEIFSEFAFTDDWRDPYDPVLEQPVCYLLHDLIDHSRLGNKIFNISEIWFNIKFTD